MALILCYYLGFVVFCQIVFSMSKLTSHIHPACHKWRSPRQCPWSYIVYTTVMTFALWLLLKSQLSYLLMTPSCTQCLVIVFRSCVYSPAWQQYLTGLRIGRWNYLHLSVVSCTWRQKLDVLSITNLCIILAKLYFQFLIVLLAIDLSFRHMSTTSQPKPHCVLSWYSRPIRSTRTYGPSVRDVRTGAFLTPVCRAAGIMGHTTLRCRFGWWFVVRMACYVQPHLMSMFTRSEDTKGDAKFTYWVVWGSYS